MASPFLVHALGGVGGMAWSSGCRTGILHDGSVLVAADSAVATCTLYHVTNPSSGAPTVTALAQTFTLASATRLPVDLLCIPGAGTTDIWLVYASDAGAAAADTMVAHATYTAPSTFTWDNTGTNAITSAAAAAQVPSIAFNGTDLIVTTTDYNGTDYITTCAYTATKNGSGGWSASFVISTTYSPGYFPVAQLIHDAKLAGGSVAATLCVYVINTGPAGTETMQFGARVLLDSAANAGNANWSAEVKDTTATGQYYGHGCSALCVDPATGQVHLVCASSQAGTGGEVGVMYRKLAVTSLGVPSFGPVVSVDTTSGSGTVSCCVDVDSTLYAFYSTGAIGSAGVIQYRTSASPYTAFSAASATVANTAGDGYPHVPQRDQAVSGYIPFLFQRGTATYSAYFDNTIPAGSPPSGANSGFLAFM